jgi:hypothetical protein
MVLGIFLLLQCILGYLSNALWYEGKPPQWYPDKLHWLVGRTLLIGGIVNCFLGTWEFDENFYLETAGPWAVVGILTAWTLGATLLMELGIGQKHEHEQLSENSKDNNNEHAALLEPSSSNEHVSSHRRSNRCFSWSRTVALSFFWLTLLKLSLMVLGLLLAFNYG